MLCLRDSVSWTQQLAIQCISFPISNPRDNSQWVFFCLKKLALLEFSAHFQTPCTFIIQYILKLSFLSEVWVKTYPNYFPVKCYVFVCCHTNELFSVFKEFIYIPTSISTNCHLSSCIYTHSSTMTLTQHAGILITSAKSKKTNKQKQKQTNNNNNQVRQKFLLL